MAYVQGTTGSSGTNVTSGSTTAITTTTGHWLAVVVSVTNGPQTVTGITDTYSNTWTPAASNPQAPLGANNVYVYYAKNIAGGASHQITTTFSAATGFAMSVIELSGRSTTSPISAQTALLEGTAVTSHTSAATGAIASNCDIVCLIGDDANIESGANQTYAATSGGWTLPSAAEVATAATTPTTFIMYVENVSVTQTATWTNSPHVTIGASVILAVAPAAAGTVVAWIV